MVRAGAGGGKPELQPDYEDQSADSLGCEAQSRRIGGGECLGLGLPGYGMHFCYDHIVDDDLTARDVVSASATSGVKAVRVLRHRTAPNYA